MPYKNIEDQRACQRRHYYAHTEYYLERNRKRYREFRKVIAAAKKRPCMDCNQNFPSYVMDFDHREDKKFNIAQLSKIASVEKLKEEIAKCDVVCANCHRIRTHSSRFPDGAIGSIAGSDPADERSSRSRETKFGE